ncbi:hypothetical protein V1281_001829 [Nitrobacteraceae bacterium AZCC 2161]
MPKTAAFRVSGKNLVSVVNGPLAGHYPAMKILKTLIPRQVIAAGRLLQVFLSGYGHSRRVSRMPVDGHGHFIPWLTYPMIEFLNGLDFAQATVFEFGAGGSTLYWAKRAREVVSVELDAAWASRVAAMAPSNVRIIHEPNGHSYADVPISLARKFDVIVVDGAERYRSTQAAIGCLASGGMIILDNAEWYPHCAALLAASGLIEVPFSGFPPINAFPSTSSAFLSRDFSRVRLPRVPPVGGRALAGGALDDKF